MSNKSISEASKALLCSEIAMPISIHHTKGNYLVDADGKRYLDFSSGYGVVNAGWRRQELTAVAEQQLKKLCYSPPWFPTEEALALAETLKAYFEPVGDYQIARASGGAEANEIVLKAAFALNGKSKVLTLGRSYHGGSRHTVNMSDFEAFRLPPHPTSQGFLKVPPPYCFRCPFGKLPHSCGLECADAVEEALATNDDIGVFAMEPVIGSGGVIIPPLRYFTRVAALCAQFGVVWLLDEVITAFGRVGALSASHLFNLKPDAICLGKGMGGGIVPIGAALLSPPLAQALKQFEDVSATFAWTPMACAVAKANINLILQEHLAERAAEVGTGFKAALYALFHTYCSAAYEVDVRGLGWCIGIELKDRNVPERVPIRQMQVLSFGLAKQGLLVCTSWEMQVMILMPPLNISEADMAVALQIIEEQLKSMRW